MKKIRVVAVCTVGLVLALLGGANYQAAVKDPNLGFVSKGVIVDLAGVTKWYLQNETYLFIPIPHSDLPQRPSVIDPINPSHKLIIPKSFIRRSLWFMDIGSRMLWGTLINNNQEIRLVFIQRLERDKYRITIEDQAGRKLTEWEGVLQRLDPNTGYGVIESQPSLSINEVILYDDGVTVIRQEGGRCITRCVTKCKTILWSAYCECVEDCITICENLPIEV